MIFIYIFKLFSLRLDFKVDSWDGGGMDCQEPVALMLTMELLFDVLGFEIAVRLPKRLLRKLVPHRFRNC